MSISNSFQDKDHFSENSNNYNRYRPGYPDQLFEYLSATAAENEFAWDCATGSGQAALQLAHHFNYVIATDASENQVLHARHEKNIGYALAYAEQPPIRPGSVDLITVAQAFHWFNMPVFLGLAKSLLKPGGILAIWSYNLLTISPQLDAVIEHLYHDILDDYWPNERKYVESGYNHIESILNEITLNSTFSMSADWQLSNLVGYLNTWSAVKQYREAKNIEPVNLILPDLRNAWSDKVSVRTVNWPLKLRVGRKE